MKINKFINYIKILKNIEKNDPNIYNILNSNESFIIISSEDPSFKDVIDVVEDERFYKEACETLQVNYRR